MKASFGRFLFLLAFFPVLTSSALSPAAPPVADTVTSTPSSVESPAQPPAPTPAADRGALLDGYFEELKDIDVNYKVIGYVLEELAKIHLKPVYPPDTYEIIGGLQYQEEGGRTVGELDVVVLDRTTGAAAMVAEVKLSGNLYRAGEKASSQLGRFRNYLSSDRIAKFHFIENPSRIFTASQFSDVGKYWRIGNTGALESGFDYEIDLTRGEADILQRRLLEYKTRLTPAAPAAPAPEKPFMGNRRSRVLHYHDCPSPPAPHNRVYFSSIEEARKAGYTKLHSCIPR